MTNEEILRKAIEKAAKNGWRRGQAIIDDYEEIVKVLGLRQLYLDVIYSHDFAKAFFGAERIAPLSEHWQQGYFIDQPQYSHMSDEWKHQSHLRELSLVRPSPKGNPIFQVQAQGMESEDKLVKEIIRLARSQPVYVWQFHLQQLVLEENPLLYLEKYL